MGDIHPTWENEYQNPSVTMEVDYHRSINSNFVDDLIDEVEQNFEMYGLDVDLQKSNTFDSGPNYTKSGLSTVRSLNHDNRSRPYVMIAPRGKNLLSDNLGKTFTLGKPSAWLKYFGAAIFVDYIRKNANKNYTMAEVRSVALHEIGHLLAFGTNDDPKIAGILSGEVYSGNPDDKTPEYIDVNESVSLRRPFGINNNIADKWSVMSEGFPTGVKHPPINGTYTPISIEEILTAEFHDIDSVGEF
jgi:hypothetical protein